MRLLTLAWFLACGTAMAQPSLLVPPDDAVAGRSQASWSQLWWQWAWSFDEAISPVADSTGFYCASRQAGEVWFLAGSVGSQRTIRSCVVPRDKYLFFPLLNFVVTPDDPRSGTCANVMSQAATAARDPKALILEIDGKRFQGLIAHRQATIGCFDLGERMTPPEKIAPAAGNGYYVMLRPLPPGTHTIHFGGVLPDLIQAVTYTIIVD